MDWLFLEDNIENFIYILTEKTNPQYLTLKPIKIFIELLWSKIQMKIVGWVLIPYMLYLFSMYKLTGVCLMRFHHYHIDFIAYAEKYEHISIPFEEAQIVEGLINKYETNRFWSYVCILMSIFLFMYFGYVEGIQLYR